MGAFALTNALVPKTTGVVLMEANPVSAELMNYSIDYSIFFIPMISFFLFALIRYFIIWGYLFFRRSIYNERQLRWMINIITLTLLYYSYDFANNFGYLLRAIIT